MTETAVGDSEESKPSSGREDSGAFNVRTIHVFGRFLSRFAGVSSAIAGLALFAYVVGWVRTQAYFDAVGAPWVTDQVGVLRLVSKSAFPLAALAFFMLMMVTDVAEGLSERLRQRTSLALIVIGTVAFFSSGFVPPGWALTLGHIALLAMVVVAAEFFTTLVTILHDTEYKWDSKIVLGFAMAFLIGLFFAPKVLGDAEGRRDRHPATSTLPVVEFADSSENEWRLLAAVGDSLYVAYLTADATNPAVRIVPAEHAISIRVSGSPETDEEQN